jgi:glutaredoxin 3
MKATVWSKNGCGFCSQAKALLESKGIEYEERNINNSNWTRDDLLTAVPTAKTLPQIFLGEEYVGGYTELRKKLTESA